METIDLALLSHVLVRDEAMVQRALDRVHTDTGMVMMLSFITMTSPDTSPAEAIVAYLADMGAIPTFIGALRAMGKEIAAVSPPRARDALAESADDVDTDPIAIIRAQSVDPIKTAAFLTASSAFRCRIKVNTVVKGSGILVSYRLVLTAWHVINRATPWDTAHPPKIEVLTSAGQSLVARPTDPSSPCHPKEWEGDVPNDNDLANYNDYALLRLSEPVGFTLGYAKPTLPPEPWAGKVPCFLLHYPRANDVGITLGEARHGGAARRYLHNAPSLGGSSGGALFSNDCEFLGIHQKAYKDKSRYFVPVHQFANDETAPLVHVLRQDRKPSYLWSTDGSMTDSSHLVIGRRVFFDALDHMVDASELGAESGTGRLRGIWTRPKRQGEDQSGMSFGFDLLKAFLARRQPDARLERMAVSGPESDIFALLLGTFGVSDTEIAAAGVRRDETTPVAFDADRAKAVVQHIEAASSGPLWLYIDGPTTDLGDGALRQMEMLVAQLAQSTRIHFVLTRMERHALPLARFDSLSDIGAAGPPGVIYEYAGDFTAEDVMTTIRAAAQDLDLRFSDDVVQFLATTALSGVVSRHGLYSASDLKTVSDQLRMFLLPHVVAA